MKREREYHGCTWHVGKNITWKNGRGSSSNIIFPIILRMLERISSGEKGKGTEISGEENKDF